MDCSALLILLSAVVAAIIDLVDGECTVPVDPSAFKIKDVDDRFYIYVTQYDMIQVFNMRNDNIGDYFSYIGAAGIVCREFGGDLAVPSKFHHGMEISYHVNAIARQIEASQGISLPNVWFTGYKVTMTVEADDDNNIIQEKDCTPKSKDTKGIGTCPIAEVYGYQREFYFYDLELTGEIEVAVEFGYFKQHQVITKEDIWRGVLGTNFLPFVCEIPCNEQSKSFGNPHTIQAELNFGAPGVECNEDTVITCGASVDFNDSIVIERFTLLLNGEHVESLYGTIRLPVHEGLRDYSCTAQLLYNNMVVISESDITVAQKCVSKALEDVKVELAVNNNEMKSELAEINKEMKSELAENNNEMKSELAENNNEMKSELVKTKNQMKSDNNLIKSELARNKEENKAENKSILIAACVGVVFVVICMIIGIVIIVLMLLGRKANKTDVEAAPKVAKGKKGKRRASSASAASKESLGRPSAASLNSTGKRASKGKGKKGKRRASSVSKESLGRPSAVSLDSTAKPGKAGSTSKLGKRASIPEN